MTDAAHGRLPRQLVEALGAELASGSLRGGDVIATAELQQRFGVSRTVARDAARVLETKRMLTSRQRVGLIARPPEEWNLYDPDVIRWRLTSPDPLPALEELTELRSAVEPTASALAAVRATQGQRQQLLTLSAEMRAKVAFGDAEGFLAADVTFHRVILQASGNALFGQLADVTEQLLRGRETLEILPAAPEIEDAERHAAVAEAIIAGRPDQADAAMRDVVRESLDDIRRRLAERDAREA